MHGAIRLASLVGVAGLSAFGLVAGCWPFTEGADCETALVGCPTSTSTSSGMGGSDGGPPPSCIPSENAKTVADSCGVFVSPAGDDSNAGTKEKPVKTLSAALQMGSTIYACAGAVPFKEALLIDKAVTIFGALDCTKAWAYDASHKTELTADADAIPLTLASTASGVHIVDVAVRAASAAADGGSSIAVVADGVMASFTRVDITAGDGKAGLAGTTPTDSVGPTDSADPGIKGNDGKAACMDMAMQFGGAAKENALCPSSSGGPLGGTGGVGAVTNGSSGDVIPANVQTALGGQGQPAADPMNLWSCAVGAGAVGSNGAPGTGGKGAQDADLGTLTKSGYAGVAGESGRLGMPGQGGGGGGGAKGKLSCAGASGGGGGAGGCGGNGGTGGQPGGSSIAIVSLGATFAFEGVTIMVGTGGNGGGGGDGQAGATGGKGGTGGNGSASNLSNACDGGNGGQGGPGGKGGGGRGGHAIGIAYTGATAPATAGVSFAKKGTAGMGGAGDNVSGNMGDGAAGIAADTQGF